MPLKESWEIFEPPTVIREGNIHGIELSYHTYPHKKKALSKLQDKLRDDLTALFERTDFLNDAIIAGRSVWIKDSNPFEIMKFFKKTGEPGNFGESLSYIDRTVDKNGVIAYSDITVDIATPWSVVHEVGHVIEMVGHFSKSKEFEPIAKLWAERTANHNGYSEIPEEAFANCFHYWYNDLFPGELDGYFNTRKFDNTMIDYLNSYFDNLLPDLVLEANVDYRPTFAQIGNNPTPKPISETISGVNKTVEHLRRQHGILGPRGSVKPIFETKQNIEQVQPINDNQKTPQVVSVVGNQVTPVVSVDGNQVVAVEQVSSQEAVVGNQPVTENPFFTLVQESVPTGSRPPVNNDILTPSDFVGIQPTIDQLDPSINPFLAEVEKTTTQTVEQPQTPQPVHQEFIPDWYAIQEEHGYQM